MKFVTKLHVNVYSHFPINIFIEKKKEPSMYIGWRCEILPRAIVPSQ